MYTNIDIPISTQYMLTINLINHGTYVHIIVCITVYIVITFRDAVYMNKVVGCYICCIQFNYVLLFFCYIFMVKIFRCTCLVVVCWLYANASYSNYYFTCKTTSHYCCILVHHILCWSKKVYIPTVTNYISSKK